MIVWHNEKYWKYHCRSCAVQTADFGDGDRMTRVAIELESEIAADVDLTRALPADGHVTTRRREHPDNPDEFTTWVHAPIDAGEETELSELVDRSREIADELDALEL